MHTKSVVLILLLTSSLAYANRGLCDQTPEHATVREPSENSDGIFKLSIDSKESNLYLPDQTYVLTLKSTSTIRPFKWFMITAEDPAVDNSTSDFTPTRYPDVGSLKTLDTDKKSRYSERCYSSIENADNSDKDSIEVHWVSPKQSNKQQRIRLRAMVAENSEVWYSGGNDLTIELEKNNKKPIDSPPLLPVLVCNLCSEARYEVIFQGKWSRISHPRHYPSKPDDNGYSHLIGASHHNNYTLWQQGQQASKGLQKLAEEANVSVIEREIIGNMSATGGTRTLIRGKRRHHPHMSESSHSLFRVDRIHHLFSVAIAMRPSPDWFLGASSFELCTSSEWLDSYEIPLYPWDAGTVDGISYESPKTMSQPQGNVERVAVGSFDRNSPFYQLNLNDLKPFAKLTVNRLEVYHLDESMCNDEAPTAVEETRQEVPEETIPRTEPRVSESRQINDACAPGEWGEWSPCAVTRGRCGAGLQARVRMRSQENVNYNGYNSNDDVEVKSIEDDFCKLDDDTSETRDCFVHCK